MFPVQDLEGFDVPWANTLRQHFTLEIQLREVREAPGRIWGQGHHEALTLAGLLTPGVLLSQHDFPSQQRTPGMGE